jgi:flagellar biosynthesis chaperone FliJ
MPVSRSLRRLLRIRDIEEEQSRLTLESALSELTRLEQALAASGERNRRGRRLVQASARNGELLDRVAGLEESYAANRLASALAPRIAESTSNVVALREQYLGKRVERRQAETLIREAEAHDSVEDGRREQRTIDDWYHSKLHQTDAEKDTRESAPQSELERESALSRKGIPYRERRSQS